MILGYQAMHLRFTQKLREFAAARGGNVAIIFTFALIPILALVGSAIDYSRGNAVKVEMQGAVNSVGLMLQKTAPSAQPQRFANGCARLFYECV